MNILGQALRYGTAMAVLWNLGGTVAQAATFVGQEIQSETGAPLRATVLLAGVAAEQRNDLSIRLATPEMFRQAGIQRPAALDDLGVISTAQLDDERYLVQLDFNRPVNTNYLDLLLVMEWSTGHQIIRYTLATTLIESTSFADAAQRLPIVSETGARPTADTSPPVAASAGERHQHVVRRGETLSSIARGIARNVDGVGTGQAMVALFEANLDAFSANDANRLRVGANLKRPSDTQMRDVTPAQTSDFLAKVNRNFGEYRDALANDVAHRAVQQSSGRSASGSISPAQTSLAPTEVPRDELRLSQSGTRADAADHEIDSIARDKAETEMSSRETDLRKNVEEMQKLLSITHEISSAAPISASRESVASVPLPVMPPDSSSNQVIPFQRFALIAAGFLLGALVSLVCHRLYTRRRPKASGVVPITQDGPVTLAGSSRNMKMKR